MGLFDKVFKKKVKKAIAACSICKAHMEEGEGFALSTGQIVSSKAYWDHKMVEPETMSYTHAHFKTKDENATKMRGIIFQKTAEKDQSWLTCESCIRHFEVDEKVAKEHVAQWWETKGKFDLPDGGTAEKSLAAETFEEVKQYATMDAGVQSMKYA
jgi:transcription elongation factor Elf1